MMVVKQLPLQSVIWLSSLKVLFVRGKLKTFEKTLPTQVKQAKQGQAQSCLTLMVTINSLIRECARSGMIGSF